MRKFELDEQAWLADLRGLMQIEATNGSCGEVTASAPLGEGVRDAIRYMLDLGEKFGFRTRMLDGYCGWIEAGEEGAPLIALLGHVDTVPVEEEGWKAPPFDATVLDGMVYGRGSIDNKGPTLLSLYAMKALEDAGGIKGKRVRLIVGGDEEGGDWACMQRYHKTEESPVRAFSPDGAYPAIYAEKGILHVTIARDFAGDCPPIQAEAGKAYNVVPAAARAEIGGAVYEAEGKAAHASRPDQGINALLELGKKMKAAGVNHPFVELLVLASTREGLGIALSDEASGELTFNPAIVEVTGAGISLHCDLRIPVTSQPEDVVAAIDEKVRPLGFRATQGFFQKPLHVAKDSPLVTTLQRVYQECTGRTDPPVAVGGGTYARAFDNAVAFGPHFPEEEDTAHKTNECWALANIHLNYTILCNAIDQI